MAETKEESKSNEESVKLFVGQVPKHMTEDELLTMFKEFALVEEVNIIKDKATRASRGCCFVICPSRDEADKAVNACHNKKTLPGASSPLQVKYADGELERLEHKLFIGMLPKNVSEVEVSELFSQYGTIKDLQLLRGSQQTSKGCAFLKYETKEQALAALEAINGKHKMEGSSVPLVVKWADTEKERQARRAQKAQSQASNVGHADSQHPSLFGAMPMGYVPPYNGYGYQAPANYGLMPYRMPPMQNQAGYHNMMPHMNQGNALRPDLGPNMNPRNYHVPPAGYVGSYPAVPGIQHPMPYPAGMISPRPMNSPPGSVSPSGGNGNSATSSGSSKMRIHCMMATMLPAANAHSAASATTTVKAPKRARATGKEKKPLDHPTYAEMLMASIHALAERKGSSRVAITNYLLRNYNVGDDSKKVGLHVSNNLKKGADSGLFERVSGVGANGRFRLGGAAKAAAKKAAKKTTTTKSPKKAATAKSPKKAAAAKSPKKAAAAKSPKKAASAKSPKKAADTTKSTKKAATTKSSKAVGDKKTAATKKTTAKTAKSGSAKLPKPKSLKKVATKSTKTTKAPKKSQIVA